MKIVKGQVTGTAFKSYSATINGDQYGDLIEKPSIAELRRLAGVPEDHDFFAEASMRPGEEDVKLPRDPDNPHETVRLSERSRFYSTPRFINAS